MLSFSLPFNSLYLRFNLARKPFFAFSGFASGLCRPRTEVMYNPLTVAFTSFLTGTMSKISASQIKVVILGPTFALTIGILECA